MVLEREKGMGLAECSRTLHYEDIALECSAQHGLRAVSVWLLLSLGISFTQIAVALAVSGF